MATSKIIKAVRKTAEVVTEGYQKIENGVVNGYKKIENGVVGGFTKITDKFVDTFLTKDGESVEEAKQRLAAEQAAREAASKAVAEKRAAEQKTRMEISVAGIEKIQAGNREIIEHHQAFSRAIVEANLKASLNAGRRY